MIVYPNAKINLGLNVVERRADGFHNIETIFFPIALKDALEIVVAPDRKFSFTTSGLSIPGNPENNLCVKAWKLLSEEYHLPPVKIHLHKVIPMGSGLGGGSSDGAFTIRLLDSLFSLNLPSETMKARAAQLGSDCPFFIGNTPVYAYGKGDEFVSVDLRFPDLKVMVAVPGIHVNTAAAYGMIRPEKPARNVMDLVSKPLHEWKDLLKNDFEKPVFREYPRINEIKTTFYEKGAVYASMSGSGAAVFGFFPSVVPTEASLRDCFIWKER